MTTNVLLKDTADALHNLIGYVENVLNLEPGTYSPDVLQVLVAYEMGAMIDRLNRFVGAPARAKKAEGVSDEVLSRLLDPPQDA